MAEYTETLADGTTITYQPSATSPAGYKRIITPPVKAERKGLFGSKTKPAPPMIAMSAQPGMQTTGAGAAASNSMFAGLQGYDAGAVAAPTMTMNPPASMAGTTYAPSVLPVKKKGLFGGGGGASTKPLPSGSRPLPNPDISPFKLNSNPGITTQPRLLPSLDPTTTTTDPNMFMAYPTDYASLSWRDKWRLNSLRRNQERAIKALRRENEQKERSERREFKRLAKIQRKVERAMKKEEIRQLREMQRHPSLVKPLPLAKYQQYQQHQQPANATATPAFWGYGTQAPATKPATAPAGDSKPMFPMLPRLAEFGIRRPLDGAGQPGTGAQWPMMSRTLAIALVEQEKETQMRMAGRGQIYGYY